MVPTHAPKPLVWLLAAAVACFISMACATEKGSDQKDSEAVQESGQRSEPDGREADTGESQEEVKVYTNEDLEKLFGEELSKEPLPLPEAEESVEQQPIMEVKVEPEPVERTPDDPLSLLRQQQAQAEERDRSAAEAQQAVAAAQERVTQLEQRILALKNPFMARPEIPEDEKADWDSMGTRERLEQTEEQLSQAREELAAAQKELAGSR